MSNDPRLDFSQLKRLHTKVGKLIRTSMKFSNNLNSKIIASFIFNDKVFSISWVLNQLALLTSPSLG